MDRKRRYFMIYKPYGMLSQFSGEQLSLKDLDFQFSKDIYPVGRLDKDSEGLLLLTNDKEMNKKILDPDSKCPKTYLTHVDGAIENDQISVLKNGVEIKVKKALYKTLPCHAEIIDPPNLPERNPPIRYRKNIPTSWIKLIIHEGKNRQVRKMCAAVNTPVLRLVRWSIGNLTVEGMKVGEVKEISKDQINRLVLG